MSNLALEGAALRPGLRRGVSRETKLGGATIVTVLVLWKLVHLARLVPAWALPSPEQVLLAFVETLRSGELLHHTGASVGHQLVGVALAALVGIPLGVVLGSSPDARAAVLPLCRLMYPIPGIAWIPIAILWFGVGFNATVFAVVASGLWPILFNTTAGVAAIDGRHAEVARVYLALRLFYVRRVLIPGALPSILAGIRLTYGVGWRVVVGAEIISSVAGLGFMIDGARARLRPDIIAAGMITIALIGWVVETWAFGRLERAVLERRGVKTVT